MDIAVPDAGSKPLAATLKEAFPRSLLNGQHALVAVIAAVTWLAMIGGVISSDILTTGSDGLAGHSGHSSLPVYAAYNIQERVPTSFGSLQVTHADLTSQDDQVQVHVLLQVDNDEDAQIDAPRFEDLRLINTLGAIQAKPKPGGWSGPAVLLGHTSATVDLMYLAPANMGVMWLEYRDRGTQWPLRVDVGSAINARPAAALEPGDIRS
jgi:hypothetical protein